MPSWIDPADDTDPRAPRPVGRPLLALNDIRGDLAGLDAILQELDGVELCGVVAAGDHCLGGPAPFEVWRRLVSLGATLIRGTTDLALGVLATDVVAAHDPEEAERLARFLATRDALGDVVCRRLSELPSTAVVSLDDRSGVMVVHGNPQDEHRGLAPDITDHDLRAATACVAEDVLVLGCTTNGFVRSLPGLLVAHAGSVSRNTTRAPTGHRTAHAVLVQPYSDGVVRAFARDVAVDDEQERGDGWLRRSAS